ncbi:MAG: MMPL family transporter [Mycolicibacterium sp.]|uniref:MMPL family transporter n=1 Tax=Mycolicibacterium sp. TaxID=2320850 RepID=UPI003D0EC661
MVKPPRETLGAALQGVARLAIRAPRRVIALALLVMVGTAIFGLPVAERLSAGGMRDPTSESSQAAQLLADKFDQGDMGLIISITSDDGVDSPAALGVAKDVVAQLQSSPYVGQVTSAWTSPAAAASLVSEDRMTGLILAGVYGGDDQAPEHARELAGEIERDRDGVTVHVGGEANIYWQVDEQTLEDLLFMEMLAMPLSFVVLVWVFGGLIAAALPMVVGIFAILGAMAVLRTVSLLTEVSIFSLNLTIALGLALAIDYTLLILSRYRDELAAGANLDEALTRTMATAGRTVLFSAMTVASSMVTMVLFPQYFLKSFAYAGVAVVAFAAVASVVVTPAAIALLGSRLDALDIRKLLRRTLGLAAPRPKPVTQTFWYRSAKASMRHAVPVGTAIIALLLLLGAPFLNVNWGFPDDRMLPTSASARQVGDALRDDFVADPLTNITVAIPDVNDVSRGDLRAYSAALSKVGDVSSVSSPDGTFVDGQLAGPPSAPTGLTDGSAFLTVISTTPLYSELSEKQLDALHAVPAPDGRTVLVGGASQINRDSVSAITDRLPLVLGIIAGISLVLLFFLTGSVVLPIKAVLLNILSLTAAFGALVWVFQEGNLGALGVPVTGALESNLPVLLFCIAFGLSMDYEVFLVARIREYWLASGRSPADNEESVALGVARTGRVITAAALIMSISFAALMASQVTMMRMFGLGLTLAVLMDATLVRILLVPAFMRVMGRANWWAPRPLARLHDRFGLNEDGHKVSP